MHKFGKIVVKVGMLSLLSAIPLVAQVANSSTNRVIFTAPFSFYAGNAKLPAGSYVITEPDVNDNIVLIRNTAGTKEELINFIPTRSLYLQNKTDLIFYKYGDTGYLRTLSVEGVTDGLEFPRTKAEARAEAMAETMAENTSGNMKVVELAALVNGK